MAKWLELRKEPVGKRRVRSVIVRSNPHFTTDPRLGARGPAIHANESFNTQLAI